MIAFGPVPSRRLGQSLGINNIPPKNCSYACVYCQVGKTNNLKYLRKEYYKPEDIFGDVQELVVRLKKNREKIDYITFVPDGEPTLDINLGNEIDLLKLLDYKVAVITNGSLITHQDVQNDLMKADYVSLKIDTTNKEIWKKINRPHKCLNLEAILESMVHFSTVYNGRLTTETMLVDGINTTPFHIQSVSEFVSKLQPYRAYVAIPTRPTAEKGVRIPDESTINRDFQIFKEKMDQVEYLIDYEGNDFGYSGEIEKDLLNITAVHPLRSESVQELLRKAKADWKVIENLIYQEKLTEVEYEGSKFYMRCLLNNVNMGESK
ncbi:MAG: radical SAM protein [Calditrichia bacterium]|nr:radical SAM protein [Calditrichia bacterium]